MAIGFVIRSGFWLSVVAANLPAPDGAPDASLAAGFASGLAGAASSLVEVSADAARQACLADPARCASLAAGAAAATSRSRDTLLQGDRAPAWKGPAERAEARPSTRRAESPRS